MGFGAVRSTEGGDERAIEVVQEVERGEDRLGLDDKRRKGCVRKGVKVCGEEEGDWRDELHQDPGLDTIKREDAVGRSKPAKRCVVQETSRTGQGEDPEKPLFAR